MLSENKTPGVLQQEHRQEQSSQSSVWIGVDWFYSEIRILPTQNTHIQKRMKMAGNYQWTLNYVCVNNPGSKLHFLHLWTTR